MTSEPWFKAYAGRSVNYSNGFEVGFLFLPSERLMRADEEGCLTLAAIRFHLYFTLGSRRDRYLGRLRPRLWIDLKSDADEIATRLAWVNSGLRA